MGSLPSLLEKEGFRAVHACWIDSSIARLHEIAPDGVLTEEPLIRAADPDDMLFGLAEQITKDPEHRLPESFAFPDKDGSLCDHVRLQWWNTGAQPGATSRSRYKILTLCPMPRCRIFWGAGLPGE